MANNNRKKTRQSRKSRRSHQIHRSKPHNLSETVAPTGPIDAEDHSDDLSLPQEADSNQESFHLGLDAIAEDVNSPNITLYQSPVYESSDTRDPDSDLDTSVESDPAELQNISSLSLHSCELELSQDEQHYLQMFESPYQSDADNSALHEYPSTEEVTRVVAQKNRILERELLKCRNALAAKNARLADQEEQTEFVVRKSQEIFHEADMQLVNLRKEVSRLTAENIALRARLPEVTSTEAADAGWVSSDDSEIMSPSLG